MVTINSSSRTARRISQQGIIRFFLLLTATSLVIVIKLTKDAELRDLRAKHEREARPLPPTNDSEGPKKGRPEPQISDNEAPNKGSIDVQKAESFPGFTKEASVVCGGHKAASCSECPQGHGAGWCNGECEWKDGGCVRSSKLAHIHNDYFRIIERYAFQPVMTNSNEYVNIIMVRSPFRDHDDEALYKFYKDEILFLGISSFEAYPLTSPNPYSAKFESEYYLNMFPGFLHMMRNPMDHFPPNVKTTLMSQSDFMLDEAEAFGKQHDNEEKIYDFVYSGGDQDVETDCVGWASYNKNFSFVREALEVMCSPEFNVTGVLVANKNKKNTKACTIPAACDGKIGTYGCILLFHVCFHQKRMYALTFLQSTDF